MHLMTRWIAFVLLATGAAAQTSSDELLTNPGAESGTLGWTDSLGHGFQSVHLSALAYVGVLEGSFAFWGGTSGPIGAYDHELRQDIDISAFSARIDAGEARWILDTGVYSRDFGGFRSTGEVMLDVLDAGGLHLDSFTTPPPAAIGAYVRHQETRALPVGARSLRYRMLARRTGGDTTDALFDRQSLRLLFPPQAYCSAKTNSQGCLPTIHSSGWPSNLRIAATNVLNNQIGLFFWGRSAQSLPFFGGTLCVMSPLQRTPVQLSGGSPTGSDCSGAYHFDFTSAYAISAWVSPGETLYGQFWSRDPGQAQPNNVGITDAIEWVVDY